MKKSTNLKEFYEDERSAEIKETIRLIRKQLKVDVKERRRLVRENKKLKSTNKKLKKRNQKLGKRNQQNEYAIAWLSNNMDIYGNLRR